MTIPAQPIFSSGLVSRMDACMGSGHQMTPRPWLSWGQVGCWLSSLLLIGLALVWGCSAPAIAATVSPTVNPPLTGVSEDDPALPPAQPDANDIPSETVSRFVQAYLAVVRLIESREMSLQQAETDTESQQMQQEIQAAAIDLIQTHDLTLQAYWELLGLANSDPEFRERVLAQVEEASL